jgi:hypothetical protein
MDELKDQIRKEALRIHEDTEITSKAHFVAAERWQYFNLWLGVPSIILSITAGSLALSKIVPYFQIIAGISGFAAASLTALMSFLKPWEKYEKHTDLGNRYLALRNDVRRFFNLELLTDKPDPELKLILDKLVSEKKILDSDSILLPNWAYKAAKKRIDRGQARYKIDKIDTTSKYFSKPNDDK